MSGQKKLAVKNVNCETENEIFFWVLSLYVLVYIELVSTSGQKTHNLAVRNVKIKIFLGPSLYCEIWRKIKSQDDTKNTSCEFSGHTEPVPPMRRTKKGAS